MNKSYGIQELYKIVAEKLRQDNERISFECHKGGYKSNHKKMYSTIIVKTVLRAFFRAIVEILSEGDIVRCFKRVIDVLRQFCTISNIPEDLVFTAREAIDLIQKSPIDID